MMTIAKSTKQKFYWAGALVGTLASGLLAGCGGSPTSTAPINPGLNPNPWWGSQLICQPGTFRMYDNCVWGYSYDDACGRAGGSIVTGAGGARGCRLNIPLSVAYGSFGRLTANNPSGPAAYSVVSVFSGRQIYFFPGDRISWSASGGWGGLTSSQLSLFGFTLPISVGTLSCNQINLDGRDSGGNLMTYMNLPSGLVGSDGATVFAMGRTGTLTAPSQGFFKVGINVPSEISSACTTLSFSSFQLTHCEDTAGTPFPCP